VLPYTRLPECASASRWRTEWYETALPRRRPGLSQELPTADKHSTLPTSLNTLFFLYSPFPPLSSNLHTTASMALGSRCRGRDASPTANSTDECPAQRPRRFCPADVVEMARTVADAFGPGGNEGLAVIRKAVEDKASDVVKTAAATAMAIAIAAICPIVTQAVKEKVAAVRLSHPASAIAKTTADIFISGFKTHMDAEGAYPTAGGPFEQRSLDEIRVAVGRAISMPMICRAHALAVSVRVLSPANDAEANGDCVTPFWPTASKSAGTSSFAV